jgi:multisubunit Na+/H+ antiporter MnhG subunit
MDLKPYVKSLRAQWVLLIQGAAFVSLAVTGFVSPPDYFDPVATTSETKRLAAFIVALLVGIFFYLGQRWSARGNAKGWALARTLLALMLVASNEAFREFKAHCTCRYDDQTVLIGIEYTDLGKHDFSQRQGGLPCEEILMNFAGKANLIWTAGSMNACRRKLTLTFLGTFSVAALSMLSTLQIVKCYKARK